MSCKELTIFLFFFFSFLFSFSFFARLELACQELCETRRVFLVPHFIYLTLPYLHNLRYVNLSNIRYLFPYRTSSQPPNLLYPSAPRALLSPPTSWFGQSHRSNQSRRVTIVPIDHIFQSSLVIPRTVKIFPILSLIHGTNQWLFPPQPEKQNF